MAVPIASRAAGRPSPDSHLVSRGATCVASVPALRWYRSMLAASVSDIPDVWPLRSQPCGCRGRDDLKRAVSLHVWLLWHSGTRGVQSVNRNRLKLIKSGQKLKSITNRFGGK